MLADQTSTDDRYKLYSNQHAAPSNKSKHTNKTVCFVVYQGKRREGALLANSALNFYQLVVFSHEKEWIIKLFKEEKLNATVKEV